MTWSMDDIPSLMDASSIERVKLAKTSKQINLETPIHMLVPSLNNEKSIDQFGMKSVIENKGSVLFPLLEKYFNFVKLNQHFT